MSPSDKVWPADERNSSHVGEALWGQTMRIVFHNKAPGIVLPPAKSAEGCLRPNSFASQMDNGIIGYIHPPMFVLTKFHNSQSGSTIGEWRG